MLTQWDPFAELNRLQEDVNRWFYTGKNLTFRPSVDIFEDAESIQISAELPGMKPEDVKVHVENGVLSLSGERKLEREDKREGYHRVERSYGMFTRSFSLPDSVDADSVHAEMKDGVLRLRLAKRQKPQPKRIEVKTT